MRPQPSPAPSPRLFLLALLTPALLPLLGAVAVAQPPDRPLPEPEAVSETLRPGVDYNAVVSGDDDVLPVYAVRERGARTSAVAFRYSGGVLTALDPYRPLWSERVGDGQLFGGFDYNRDGWIDLGLVRSRDTGERWGAKPVQDTWLDLVDGRTGALVRQLTPPTRDRCWDFRTRADRDAAKVYATSQWTPLSVLFGDASRTIAVLPYYAEDGAFLTDRRRSATFARAPFVFPSSARYDQAYAGIAAPAPWNPGQSFQSDSHCANGLMLNVGGEDRVLLFTSGRAVQYGLDADGRTRLVADRPFLDGGRRKACRNYGLVMLDPAAPLAVLISGTSAYSLYQDMQTGKMEHDPNGGIERHVAVYNYRTNELDDRFFSTCEGKGFNAQYNERVVYPNHCLIPTGRGASRLAFNVYSGGRWYFHVTRPGSAADAHVYKDLFVWDVRDLDNDGRMEIIASPARYPDDPDTAGYYFVKRDLWVLSWDEGRQELPRVKVLPGMLPHLVPAFREATCSTSYGSLYPVLTSSRGGRLKLVCDDAKGALRLVDF
jgi:hypothetical protein